MNFHQLRQYCLEKKGAIEDFPFGDDVHVIKVGGKMFALLSAGQASPNISLKCEPEYCDILRKQYAAIKPGYHLNKRHWNTVESDGSVPAEEITDLVDRSYNLVFKGLKKSEKEMMLQSFSHLPHNPTQYLQKRVFSHDRQSKE